jgi:hypothetical protein
MPIVQPGRTGFWLNRCRNAANLSLGAMPFFQRRIGMRGAFGFVSHAYSACGEKSMAPGTPGRVEKVDASHFSARYDSGPAVVLRF